MFVDDEQRVLNSMRIMFRRKFDLYLASRGAEALEILKSKNIDVIVADHRMPQMTGVEVLTQARTISPRTVRILLTGYADLDAVEGSINEGEVFRFLTKPCPPDELRETITLAAELARDVPPPTMDAVPDAVALESGDPTDEEILRIIMQSDETQEVVVATELAMQARRQREAAKAAPGQAPAAKPRPRAAEQPNGFDPTATDVIEQPPAADAPAPDEEKPQPLKGGLGVIVFSGDDGVVDIVKQAVRGRVPVFPATNIIQVIKILASSRPGVLLTDIAGDKASLQTMMAKLKEHLPELVTIVLSEHRDVMDMVWLINHGQIYRFLRKPLSAGRCAVSLQSALKHHQTLLRNPALVRRHVVVETAGDSGLVDSVVGKLKGVRRLWASA